MNNIMLLTDSYKQSHWKQYPSKTEVVYSYFESRGGDFNYTKFFGLQYLLQKYLAGKVVTQEKINRAGQLVTAHMGPNTFNWTGWEYILHKHNGRLPVKIRAVPEGLVVPTGNVLITVENTDPACFWLTNFLETLLVQVWYPTTVCTQSYYIKGIIKDFLEMTGDPDGIDFKLHDFGFRGVSSVESAGIGGCAHLVNFKGTDTLEGLLVAQDYYGCDMAGFSIPATEHSTITSWGRENETAAFKNILEQYPTGLVACVSDSYNIYDACEKKWGGELKKLVENRNGTLVVRPDSSDPVEVVLSCLNLLGNAFGYTVNKKGYKVLPDYIRVIQGDGVDKDSIREILSKMYTHGWSADNVAFGSGGALLQKLNRDTQKFAFKCSAIKVDGNWRDVYKQPVDEPFKESKKGKLSLRLVEGSHGTGYYTSNSVSDDVLQTVFENGIILRKQTLEEIRKI